VHGQGTHEYWKQADILDRAIAVCEFLRHHRRTETALLNLWFAGFDVEPKLVRAAWLKGLGRHSAWIKRKSESRLDPDALFSNMAIAAVKRPEFEIDRHTAAEALTEILHAYFRDAYRLDIEGVLEPVAIMLQGILTSKDPTFDVSDLTSKTSVVQFFSFIQNVLSLEAKRRLIESTTEVATGSRHLG
jgi:hypothetical protein